MHYYIKLILNTKIETELIYGFCVPTEQSVCNWKTVQTAQKCIVCCYAIINEKGKNEFVHSITNSINYREWDHPCLFHDNYDSNHHWHYGESYQSGNNHRYN